MKRSKRGRRTVLYTFTVTVLKQVSPVTGISFKAISITNSFVVNYTYE
jgi:hypothetical protein